MIDVEVAERIVRQYPPTLVKELVELKNLPGRMIAESLSELTPTKSRITPPILGLIASQGLHQLQVLDFPRIAIISTGDDLVEPGDICQAGQSFRSTPYLISAQINILGTSLNKISFYHFMNRPKDVAFQFEKILRRHSLIIISGGAEAEKLNFMPSILNDFGFKIHFNQVGQFPAKEFLFATGKSQEAVFVFPSDPAESLICTRRYILPLLAQALGFENQSKTSLSKGTPFKLPFIKNTVSFYPVLMQKTQGERRFLPLSLGNELNMFNLGQSDGFIQLPALASQIQPEEYYSFYSWREV